MNDMRTVIIPKSDQWNADDFLAGPRTVTVAGVSIKAGTEQPVSITIENDTKVFRPCKSMCRVMVACWGPDANAYIGRSMTLFCDPDVKWGGMTVGGIRISHMTDLKQSKTMFLTATKGNKKPFVVEPLKAAALEPAASVAPKPTPEQIKAALVARFQATETDLDHEAILSDATTAKQIAWLARNKSDLAAEVEAARLESADRTAPLDDDTIDPDVPQ